MNSRTRLPHAEELDGLRGLLASWVAISHILLWCGFASFKVLPRCVSGWETLIFAMPAVETFIILSGFAISFLLDSRQQSYGTFLRGRFFRIYPVYLVCLIFGACTMGLTPMIHPLWQNPTAEMMQRIFASERGHFFAHALGHLSLLNGVIPTKLLQDATGTILPPGWSITLEWQYYLLAPIIARWVQSSSRLLVLGGIAFLGEQYAYHWQNPHPAFLPAQLPLFLLGIGSYHVYAHFCATSGSRSARYALAVSVFCCAAMVLRWHSIAMLIWALAFGSILVQGPGFVGRGLAVISRILRHPLLQQLGRVSYPLYLVHWPVILLCFFLLGQWKPGIASMEAAMWMLLIAPPIFLGAATALHRWVEAPFMKIGRGIA